MNNKIRTYIVLIVISILIVTIGFTTAYFVVKVTGDNGTDIKVSTENHATLEFLNNQELVINATMNNFDENGDTLSGVINPIVKLTAESSFSESYYVYFNIYENNFVYSQNDTVAEIVLVVKDSNGNVITDIDGLSYVTSGGISGFDITTKKGIYKVADDYVIKTNGKNVTIQEWEFSLYFIHLDTIQNVNANKLLRSGAILQNNPLS